MFILKSNPIIQTHLYRQIGSTDLDQDRAHNKVNEIDDITTNMGAAWTDPQHDAAGNMITMPQPLDPTNNYTPVVYDAWNRLVSVNMASTEVVKNEYDGLNQRIVKDVTGGDTFDYYYNDQWQVLEERKNGDTDPLSQYVWHPYYIDALAVRYYDENTDNSGIVRHWYLQDANFNVTGIVNDSATVLERYHYTPYGEVTFLEPDFDPIVGNASAIGNNILYTGRERDPETGLQLNRERFYHSPLGRWLTRDPIRYRGSQWNLYEYLTSQPLNGLDPMGANPYKEPGPDNCQRHKWRYCINYTCPMECSDAGSAGYKTCMQQCRDKCDEEYPDPCPPNPPAPPFFIPWGGVVLTVLDPFPEGGVWCHRQNVGSEEFICNGGCGGKRISGYYLITPSPGERSCILLRWFSCEEWEKSQEKPCFGCDLRL